MRGNRRDKNIFKVLVGWSGVGEYGVIGVGWRASSLYRDRRFSDKEELLLFSGKT